LISSKATAKDTLSSLQSSVALWAMYQNIDMKILFETNFKHLWNAIKSPKIDDYEANKCTYNF